MRKLLLAAVLAVLHATTAPAQDTPDATPSLTPNQIAEAATFGTNVSLSVLQHELGHLLVHEFDLPVLGNEEDAADAAGALMMLGGDDDAIEALADGALAWLLMNNARATDGYVTADFYDVHSLSLQRAYKLVCLMVGSDAVKFRKLADEYGLDPDRQASCSEDYRQALNSWQRVLEPHVRPDPEDGTAAEPTGGKISISYEPPAPEHAGIARLLKLTGFLEEAAERISTTFVLPRDLVLRTADCGMDNAWYDEETAEVVFCYELADYVVSLKANQLAEGAAEATATAQPDADAATGGPRQRAHVPRRIGPTFGLH